MGIASVSAASEIVSDDTVHTTIDDNAIDELILEETDNAVSDAVQSDIDNSISDTTEPETDNTNDKSLGSSSLKDGETTIYVSKTGEDSNDGLSEETAVATVGKAYALAGSGSTINVGAGIYVVNGITISKDITIKANVAGTTVFDGNAQKMFTVNSPATLTLQNLILCNGGTSGGGFVTVSGAGKVNIEGSRFENSTSSSEAAILSATDSGAVISIKDSSFDNINCTNDYTLMKIAGNLSIERSNFTNIVGKYNSNWYGAIGLTSNANATITESQFINITGGDGSAIYFNSKGNLNVTKSLFMNNKNQRGTIFLNNNPSSANINYNLFVDNEVATSSYAKDVYISSANNVNASYNFWGSNSQPSSKEITNVEKAPVWTILEMSGIGDTAYIGDNYVIDLKVIATDGVENISLDGAMDGFSFDLSASSGSIEPGTVTIANDEASATYTPSEEGFVTISASPSPFELMFRVLDPSKMLVVSGDGNDESGAGTLDNPFATIAKALSQVTETRNVIYLLKSENAYKEHGLTVSGDVIVKCEDETVTVDGENQDSIFTVTGTLAIEDLNLINGQSDAIGGAIYVNGGNLNLSNVKISNSTASYGGAIGTSAGSALTVSNSTFSKNEASYGGAIYIDTESAISISSNSFASNTAEKGEAIYIKGAPVNLSENTMTVNETIYLESGSVNSYLSFLSNKTLSGALGETLTLNATLTDDKGNVIRGGSVIFTADGETIGTVDLSSDSPLEIIYVVPTSGDEDILISGSYTLDNGGTVKTGVVHPAVPHWFIEGGRGYEFLAQAVEAANDGDVIYGETGTYTVNGITISKNITIKANETGTIVLDGNRTNMFNVNSPSALTLLNLVLCNGGTREGGFVSIYGEGTLNLINSTARDLRSSNAGGLVYMDSSGKLNIEGCHIENISSSSAAIIHAFRMNQATGETPVITIRDSSFNNINNTYTWGDAVIEIRGNLTIERSNFTNIMGTTGDYSIGAIGSGFNSNYYISECQFINITGGQGSAIYFDNNGNIIVTKCVFMNNKNNKGSIYLNNPASANINYNLFIDNEAKANNPRDIYLTYGSVNAYYNFWGNNSQATESQISNAINADYWTIVELSSSINDAYLGTNSIIDVKFVATNGVESIPLDDMMPEYSFELGASSGIIDPASVTIVNNKATATYTPEATGTVTITATPGPASLELNVVDPSVLLFVSDEGSDETGAGTLDNPYKTIAKALSQVTESRNIIYLLKSENAYKEHDLAVEGNVIIQGEDKTVTIDGENAGRIFIVTGNATIQNLKLINGQSDSVGGAIYVNGGNLTLTNAEISNSNALNGGAIGTSTGSGLTVSDSGFSGNGATNGGAIYIDTKSAISISLNSFASNTATKGEAIYIRGAPVSLSENTMTELETIYLESGSVTSILTFLSNSTIYKDFGQTIDLPATLTDDRGNVIRGGSVIFTANGVTIGTADLSGDSPLQISYTVPTETEVDIIISGSYSFDNGGTVLNGAIHPPILYWFIEGGNGYETLAEAVEAAQSGDVIYGKAGTYIVNGITISKDLTIKANETGTIVLDGNYLEMFNVSSSFSLTLANLDLTKGGSGGGGFVTLNGGTLNLINCTLTKIDTSRKGGAIYLSSESIVNIEGCHFENIKSTNKAAVIFTLSNMISVVKIKDSSFNDINSTDGSALMEIHGNLSIERSNFTNIKGSNGEYFSGAIAMPGYYNNAFISECQFINITGGSGSSIFLNAGNLTVSKSVFMNNRNTQGTIYVYNSSSANINYNLFIDNVCNANNNGKDIFLMYGKANLNADYNFFGNNSQPTENEITFPEKMSYWAVVELSAKGSNAILGYDSDIFVRFVGTNGAKNVTLDEAMPEYSFDLSASSGTIAPGTVTLVNNEAIATYTPATTGAVTITASPGPAELVLNVLSPSDLLVVSNEGSDETGDGTLDNPYATIAKALTQVSESRNVIYLKKSENPYKEHDLTLSDNVIIKCEDKAVTIDGENAGRIFIVTGTARIEDLNLINAQSSDNGGAIYVNGGDLTVSNCVFSSNTAAKGEAIYMESGSLNLSGNTITDDETIYLAGGTVNYILIFLDNATVNAEFGETINLTATLTDDNGNAIRGGLLTFTANGEAVGTVDLSGDSPLAISYTAPSEADSDIAISGSYSYDGGNVINGTVHAAAFNWFIEGGDRYETLEQAIEAAENGDVIYANPGTYNVNWIEIEKNITIKANESGSIVLNGNGKWIFRIYADVILENLTFINGSSNSDGGLIIHRGSSLVINNSAFKESQSTSGRGAAIYVDSSAKKITIENSAFDNIKAYSALIYCQHSLIINVSKTNFTNINVSKNGIFYFYFGGINLIESQFINITGDEGAAVYLWDLNDNNITKCLFDNVTTGSHGIIYAKDASANINYNVFLNINQGVDSSSPSSPANADYNYWGSNDPRTYATGNTVMNNWVIMNVNPLSAEGIVGEPIEITVDFKHTLNTAGEIGELGDTLPIEFTVYASSDDGSVNPAELTTVDSEAKFIFTPLLKGENTLAIVQGTETIPVVITAVYKTSSHLQKLIDETPEGGVLDLSNQEFENISGINIAKDISIVGDNTTILTAGDGNPVFNIASDLSDVKISGINFVANNGDVLIKAKATNATDPLSIETPNIEVTDNKITTANENVVAESITVLKLESERGILSPTGNICITNNVIDAGITPFIFDVTSINTETGPVITPQNLTVERKATVIHYQNMNTTAVDQSVDGRSGEWFKFKLTDTEGNPIANTPMQIGFLGVVYDESYGIITDANGVAKLQINLGWKGDYTFAICFLGNDEYNASFVVAKIIVNPQKGSLTVPNKSYSASAKTKTLTATFKSASGKPVAGKTIKFTVNGKTYSAKTNSKGVASVNVSLSKKGTYSFTAKYTTNGMYATMTKTAKLTIK